MASFLELTIDRAVAGGRMLARHDGQVVLVRGAIPGERVLAWIEKAEKRGYFLDFLDFFFLCFAAFAGAAALAVAAYGLTASLTNFVVFGFKS